MMIGGLGGVVRWLSMPFDWPFAAFALLQTLHALTFGATHLGTMHWFADHVEDRDLSVVNGATFVAGGVCMGVSVLASGWLYARYGAGAFAAMALPALRRRDRGVDRAALNSASPSTPQRRLRRKNERAVVAQGVLAVARQQQRAVEIDEIGILGKQHGRRHRQRGARPCSRP